MYPKDAARDKQCMHGARAASIHHALVYRGFVVPLQPRVGSKHVRTDVKPHVCCRVSLRNVTYRTYYRVTYVFLLGI